jgi:hypothetical protein
MIDLIVDRREMKSVIARALRFMGAAAADVPAPAAFDRSSVAEPAPQL